MVKVIDESLYRWEKEGWTAQTIDNGQYTLVHALARPVVCGLRTSFQTVGAIQGEMQRALRDGPKAEKPKAVEPPAPPIMARRVKSKRKPIQSNGFSFDDAGVRHPLSPYRKRPQVVEQPESSALLEPFHNAAWELAHLRALDRRISTDVIAVMERRYQTDETYRARLIRIFRETPQTTIQSLRKKVEQWQSAE
jgi:hypothetical protein